MLTELWITPSSFYLMKLTFLGKESGKMSGMFPNATLQSQTLTLSWFQLQMLLMACLNI